MKGTRMLVLFFGVAVLGCASAANSVGTPSSASYATVITHGEIVGAGTGNAYEVIRRLRPNFLLPHGATTVGSAQELSAYPNVYVDGMIYGDINSLRNLDVTQIGEVRYYAAPDAQARFGTGNTGGVIAITSNR